MVSEDLLPHEKKREFLSGDQPKTFLHIIFNPQEELADLFAGWKIWL